MTTPFLNRNINNIKNFLILSFKNAVCILQGTEKHPVFNAKRPILAHELEQELVFYILLYYLFLLKL